MQILDALKERAIAKWGDNWPANLVQAYAKLEGEETGNTIDPNARRSQVMRVFEKGTCTLPTVIRLSQCVGGRFQITFSETKTF